MLKRTFFLAAIFGAILAVGVVALFQVESRPFTAGQLISLFLVSSLPGLGFALFFDPYAKKKKEEYMQIDFYKEDD